MRLWQRWARCFNGMVMAKRRDIATGLDILRDELEQADDVKFLPRFLLPLGEFAVYLGEAGKIAEGIAIVDAALASCKARDEGWYLAELQRIRGDLVLRIGQLRGCRAGRGIARAAKAPFRGNCAPPQALPGCGAIRAAPSMRRDFSCRSTSGLPKGLRPPI